MAHTAHDVVALQAGLAALQQSYAALHQELGVLGAKMAEEGMDSAPAEDSLGNVLSYMWVIICGLLVFFMQAGFALVESGTCREKNCLSILAKNQIDFLSASLAWFLFGWAFAFGDAAPTAGIVGTTGFVGTVMFDGAKVSDNALMFFFQQMFCAVAATIVSGGIAERASLKGYIFFSFVMALCIYPVVVCWCWNPNGWLATRGFYDFAGSGVVHLTGGMGALAGAWILGPRAGRFGSAATQDSHEFNPHSVPFIALGTMILQFGWYAFNAGSTLAMQSEGDAKTAVVACVNTTIAAASAATISTAVSLWQTRRWDVPTVCNSILAGCVSITAGCASVGPWSAMFMGAVGGIVFLLATQMLERLHIDDPVGAFPVHGACGAWGVLATSLFHTGFDALGEPSQGPGILVQLQGVLVVAAFSGAMCLCVFMTLRRAGALEHSVADQMKGLDRDFTQGAYSTGEVGRFLAFISHAKRSHGACARWLQLELAVFAHGKSKIFLDSDNLVNLNTLLSTVRDKVECLVVLASEDIWWRPWCAGEIAVATQYDVPIVLVMMEEEYVPLKLDFTQIASQVRDKISSDALETLRPFGIGYEDIQDAYRKLDTYPQVNFGVYSELDTKVAISQIATLAGLKGQSNGTSSIESLKMRAEQLTLGEGSMLRTLAECVPISEKPPSCIILCDTDDIEATAASYICEKALAQAAEHDSERFKVVTCAGMSEEKVFELVSGGMALIVILSKDALKSRLVQRSCLLRASALWPDGLVGIVAEGARGQCCGLPVAVNPELGFEFPTPAFYEYLLDNHPHLHRPLERTSIADLSQTPDWSRSSVNFAWDAIELPYPDGQSAATALSGFFKLMLLQIASPLSTHRSWKSIQQQAYWIYERAVVAKRMKVRTGTLDSAIQGGGAETVSLGPKNSFGSTRSIFQPGGDESSGQKGGVASAFQADDSDDACGATSDFQEATGDDEPPCVAPVAQGDGEEATQQTDKLAVAATGFSMDHACVGRAMDSDYVREDSVHIDSSVPGSTPGEPRRSILL